MNIAAADSLMAIFGIHRQLCPSLTPRKIAADVCRCRDESCPEKMGCTRYTQPGGERTPYTASMRHA